MRPRRIPVRRVTSAPKPPAPTPHFRPADRADCCSAQALVEVRLPGHDAALWFCGHHYRRHEPALTARGARVTADGRPLLTKPYEGIE